MASVTLSFTLDIEHLNTDLSIKNLSIENLSINNRGA